MIEPIDRNEAIRRFEHMRELTADQVVEMLKRVPSCRRKGEWIEDARTYYETLNERGYFVDQHTPYFLDDIACPNCLAKFSTIDNETERFDFCPNCGADMRGEDE